MFRRIRNTRAYAILCSALLRAINGVFAFAALPFVVATVLAVGCNSAAKTPTERPQDQAAQSLGQQQRRQHSRETGDDSLSGSRSHARILHANVGFRSRNQFDEHFAKHGAEFGAVTQQEYLREAQMLRDAPVGGNVEEIGRPDGTVSRYDRASGAFIAFNSDGTIRTFFKPNNGEAYFRRQAMRSH